MKSLSLHAIAFLIATAPLFAQDAPPPLIIDPLGHSGTITELLFRASTDELISVGEDKAIRFWDINTGELLRTLRGEIGEGSDGQLFTGALSKDDRYLAVAGISGNERASRIPSSTSRSESSTTMTISRQLPAPSGSQDMRNGVTGPSPPAYSPDSKAKPTSTGTASSTSSNSTFMSPRK